VVNPLPGSGLGVWRAFTKQCHLVGPSDPCNS
jgi:hypothetical protein